MSDTIEARARELANEEFQARMAEVRASWDTDRPISLSGPFSGLDYKISAEEWDRTSDNPIKEVYRKQARQGLA